VSELPRPPAGALLLSGTVFYALLALAALGWLSQRDRGDAFADAAIGAHGALLGAAAGLVVGCLGAVALGRLARRVPRFRLMDRLTRAMFAGIGDLGAMVFVLMAAIGEELFFRLAVQDAFGLPGSVAAYVLVNSSVGGLRWLPYLLVHAAVLGLLVQQGFGLLGSTVANAIMNHLNLWRLRCR
jgi:membrane protease YdiL (CAAX protease family)